MDKNNFFIRIAIIIGAIAIALILYGLISMI